MENKESLEPPIKPNNSVIETSQENLGYKPPDVLISEQDDMDADYQKNVTTHTANMMKRKAGEDPYNRNKELNSKYQRNFGCKPEIFNNQLSSRGGSFLQSQYDKQSIITGETYSNDDDAQDIDVRRDGEACCEPEDLIKKFIINHKGSRYFIWHETIDFLCIISSFIYAHYAAYRHEEENLFTTMIIIEGAFVADFLMNFILDYPDPNDPKFKSVKDVGKISQQYMNGDFTKDLIALAPLHLIKMSQNRQKLLYIVKLIRLLRGFGNFDVMEYLQYYKDKQSQDLLELIEEDPVAANSIDTDQIKIQKILMFSYFLKLMKIVIIIGSCSYFFAMFFMFLIEIQNEILNYDNFAEDQTIPQEEHFTQFYHFYNFDGWSRSEYEQMVILLYFSFTSLTTVGFGDFNPRSNIERLYIAFGLLFGVSIFSYIMGQFIDIINKFKQFNADNGDDDALNKFFGVMAHYNNDEAINIDMKRDIEQFFEHKWDQGRNYVFQDLEYKQFLDQIPDETKDKMLTDFLFIEFIKHYKSTMFDIPMPADDLRHARYTWKQPAFREFMYQTLIKLEPIRYYEGMIIMDENEPIEQIVFIMDAFYHIGFCINNKQYFKIKMKHQDIGAYGMTMNQKSEYIYKTTQDCDGYFIRMKNWAPIIGNPDIDDVIDKVKEKLCKKYEFLHRSMKMLKKHELGKIKSNIVIQLTDNPEFIIESMKKFAGVKTEEKEKVKEVQIIPINEKKVEIYVQNINKLLENMHTYQESLQDAYLDLEEKNDNLSKELSNLQAQIEDGDSQEIDNEIKETMEQIEEYKRKYKDLELKMNQA